MNNLKFRPVGKSGPIIIASCTQKKRSGHTLSVNPGSRRKMNRRQLIKYMADNGFTRAR